MFDLWVECVDRGVGGGVEVDFRFCLYGAWEVGLLCFLGPRVDGVRRLAWLDLSGVFMMG